MFFSKKKLPKEAIELDESRRGDPTWINAVVEVGLNNSLLQNGHLEVIDAPGMSENEALDRVVDECLHGALQVIIYVVDGNSSLRLQVSMLLKTATDVKKSFYPITDAEDYDMFSCVLVVLTSTIRKNASSNVPIQNKLTVK